MNMEFPVLPLAKVRKVVGKRREKHRKIVWHSAELYVKTFLTYDEFRDLVDSIIQSCSGENGYIIYEMVDFAIKANVITYYALIELPTDFEELHYLVYETDLYNAVCKNVNAEQIAAIVACVNLIIQSQDRR